MSDFEFDSHHLHTLRAVEGWIGLGSTVEARAELEQLPLSLVEHPEVVRLRCELSMAEKDWEEGVALAATLIQVAPEDPLGWFHRSFCLHELKRTAEARDNLLRVVDRFPESSTMRYNLACYECQLSRLEHAREWWRKACKVGDPAKLRAAALEDRDLEPLWNEIRATKSTTTGGEE